LLMKLMRTFYQAG